MIGVNKLRTKVLITSDEVIFHAPTDQAMDPRIIEQNIVIAERRFVKPALGASVYDKLINNKNLLVNANNITTLQAFVNEGRPADRKPITLRIGDYVNSDTYLNADQLLLWTDYLHKIVAECVWFTALPVNRSRFTSMGVQKNFPESIASSEKSASVDLKDLKHLMDRGLQDRIEVLLDDMHAYLCSVAYSGYTKNCDECNGTAVKKTDFILGMYDDEDDCRGCGNSYNRSSSSSSGSSGSTSTCLQDRTILFSGVDELIINWNADRKRCFGSSASFTVELQNGDGEYELTTVPIVADSVIDTSLYKISELNQIPGRITIA